MKKIIFELAKQNELSDLSRDLVEIILDEQIKDGVLKEIPIIKSIYSVFKGYNSISDKIHLKKTLIFLLELKEITQEERMIFVEDLSDKYSSGSEKLMLAISKLDSYEKCAILGRLSILRAKNQINIADYLRLCKVVQDAYIDDLYIINEIEVEKNGWYESYMLNVENVAIEELTPLLNLGLICQSLSEPEPISKVEESYDEYSGGGVKQTYFYSDTGKILKDNFNEIFKD